MVEPDQAAAAPTPDPPSRQPLSIETTQFRAPPEDLDVFFEEHSTDRPIATPKRWQPESMLAGLHLGSPNHPRHTLESPLKKRPVDDECRSSLTIEKLDVQDSPTLTTSSSCVSSLPSSLPSALPSSPSPLSPDSPTHSGLDERSFFESHITNTASFPPGYTPKRKEETPAERDARKAWDQSNLSTHQRKQLRAKRRGHKKAVLALREAKQSTTPLVKFKCKGEGSELKQHFSQSGVILGPQEIALYKDDMCPVVGEVEPTGQSLKVLEALEAKQSTQHEVPCAEGLEQKEDEEGYCEYGCWCLHRDSFPRKQFIQFVSWSWFDQFILIVIVLNCLSLAMFDPLDQDCKQDKCKVLAYAELVFNIIFICEMLIKMTALGVLGSNAYMDNSWNRLDFAIVCTSIVDFFPGNDSPLAFFRTFRVLRPLRAINRFPNLRILVKLLLNTLPMLASVGVLCFLLFFVLGVVGMQLWAGVLQQRCVDPSNLQSLIDPDSPFVCTMPSEHQNGWTSCPPPDYPSYTECRKDYGNPFYGTSSFDNIYVAWITLFQVLTLEAWVDIMYLLQDSYSFHVWIYFFGVVLFCNVFALNLVLVVISSHFGQTKEDDKQEQAETSTESVQATAVVVPEDEVDEDLAPADRVREGRCKILGRRFIESPWFTNTVMIGIIINMLFMAAEHHGQSALQDEVSDWANTVLTWAFFAEMMIKLTVLGFTEYFSDGFNSFDCVIVVVSLVEFFMSGSGGLSVLRSFRLVRAFKVIRFIESLQIQMAVIGRTLSDMVAFFILLFLFIFIFAILGMNLFGGLWNFPDTGVPRTNFDTFPWALITVFQVLTLEDWNLIMHIAVRAGGLATPLYFIALITMGNFIILNLFVAILIAGFEDSGPDEPPEAPSLHQSLRGKERQLNDQIYRLEEKYVINPEFYDTKKLAAQGIQVADTEELVPGSEVILCKLQQKGVIMSVEHDDSEVEKSEPVYNVKISKTGCEMHVKRKKLVKFHAKAFNPEKERRKSSEKPSRDLALCCLHRDNCIRQACVRLVARPEFEQFIMFLISANSISLAVERPAIDPNSMEREVLDTMGYVFTACFSVELFVKVVAMGFVSPGDSAYLSNGWNRLDGFLVFASWVDQACTLAGVGSSWVKVIRVFRMLRTLRPLRMINKAKKLRNTVNSLIASIAPLGSTLIIIAFVFLIFGILGNQLFSGKFSYCDTSTTPAPTLAPTLPAYAPAPTPTDPPTTAIATKTECLRAGGTWTLPPYHFDNLGSAFLTLFVVATIDGWVVIMHAGTDAVGVDMEPRRNASEGYAWFFVLFVMIGAFFSLNIFIGVVVDNFQQSKRQMAREEFEAADTSSDGNLSRDELAMVYGSEITEAIFDLVDKDGNGSISKMEFMSARKHLPSEMLRGQPTSGDLKLEYESLLGLYYDNLDPDGFWAMMFRFSQSTCFEMSIFGIIIANILMMSIEYYNQPELLTQVIQWMNLLFTIIFIGEAAIKLLGLGCHLYWKDPWNCFDMFVVAVSIIGSTFDIVGSDSLPINPTILRLLRILRLVRVLKVLKNARGLMILLSGVQGALPHVFNLTIMLTLLFFIFSAMGVQLLGTLKCDDDHPCLGLSKYCNFQNFGMGMFTLFRVTTGDNWNGILADALRSGCNEDADCAGIDANCCTAAYLVVPFFVVFNISSQLVILNIIVALLMEELENATAIQSQEEEKVLRDKVLAEKSREWFSGKNPGYLRRKDGLPSKAMTNTTRYDGRLEKIFDRIDALLMADDQVSVGELRLVFGPHADEFMEFCDKNEDQSLTKREFVEGIKTHNSGMSEGDFKVQWVDRMENAIKVAEEKVVDEGKLLDKMQESGVGFTEWKPFVPMS